jgi:ParB-like chromosome segregation protein Spo0J
MVGLTNIEAIVRTVSDESQHRALAAVANFCREELTPLEEAAAVQMLKDERKMSNAEIAKNVGKSIGWVTQRVTLLKLPLEVKALMDPTKPESEQLRFSAALLLADLPEQMAVKAAKHLVTHKLIGVAATTYIQRTAQEQAGKQARRRRPRDTMQSLRRAVVGLNEVVDFVGGMNRKDFSNLLRTRPEDEVKDTEAAVVECIANLENILVELKQAHSTDVVKVGGVNA